MKKEDVTKNEEMLEMEKLANQVFDTLEPKLKEAEKAGKDVFVTEKNFTFKFFHIRKLLPEELLLYIANKYIDNVEDVIDLNNDLLQKVGENIGKPFENEYIISEINEIIERDALLKKDESKLKLIAEYYKDEKNNYVKSLEIEALSRNLNGNFYEGYCLANGVGCAVNKTEAEFVFLRGAENCEWNGTEDGAWCAYELAQYQYVWAYRGECSEAQVFNFMKIAAKHDHIIAQFYLADYYFVGYGCDPDDDKSYYWAKKAIINCEESEINVCDIYDYCDFNIDLLELEEKVEKEQEKERIMEPVWEVFVNEENFSVMYDRIKDTLPNYIKDEIKSYYNKKSNHEYASLDDIIDNINYIIVRDAIGNKNRNEIILAANYYRYEKSKIRKYLELKALADNLEGNFYEGYACSEYGFYERGKEMKYFLQGIRKINLGDYTQGDVWCAFEIAQLKEIESLKDKRYKFEAYRYLEMAAGLKHPIAQLCLAFYYEYVFEGEKDDNRVRYQAIKGLNQCYKEGLNNDEIEQLCKDSSILFEEDTISNFIYWRLRDFIADNITEIEE